MSCSNSAKEAAKPPSTVSAPAQPLRPAPAYPATGPGGPQAGDAPANSAGMLGGAPIGSTLGEGELPELTEVKALVLRGDRSARTLKELQRLSYKYPKNAEVAYILGQFYCSRLWMSDCIENFRRALQLEPSLRSNSYLIEAVVPGLGSDSDHTKVRRFLAHDIGQPAAPFLEQVLKGTWRQQVKDRAAATLHELK